MASDNPTYFIVVCWY